MDKSYEGAIRLGRATATYDREGETVGPDRDSAAVTAETIEERRRRLSRRVPAVAAALLRQESRGPEVLRDGPQGGDRSLRAQDGPRLASCRFGPSRTGFFPSRSPARPEPTSARSPASSARSSAAGPTWRPCGGSRIGVFSASDAVTLERFEAFSPAERLASPHAVPLARVPFPFPRIQLASLEAWKIRRGQSVPSRGVHAREGEWVTLLGPSNDMLALGQVSPIGDRGVALIKPRIVLE